MHAAFHHKHETEINLGQTPQSHNEYYYNGSEAAKKKIIILLKLNRNRVLFIVYNITQLHCMSNE